MSAQDMVQHVESTFAKAIPGGLPQLWQWAGLLGQSFTFHQTFTYSPWQTTLAELKAHFSSQRFVFIIPETWATVTDRPFRQGLAKALKRSYISWEPLVVYKGKGKRTQVDVDSDSDDDSSDEDAVSAQNTRCKGCSKAYPADRLGHHAAACKGVAEAKALAEPSQAKAVTPSAGYASSVPVDVDAWESFTEAITEGSATPFPDTSSSVLRECYTSLTIVWLWLMVLYIHQTASSMEPVTSDELLNVCRRYLQQFGRTNFDRYIDIITTAYPPAPATIYEPTLDLEGPEFDAAFQAMVWDHEPADDAGSRTASPDLLKDADPVAGLATSVSELPSLNDAIAEPAQAQNSLDPVGQAPASTTPLPAAVKVPKRKLSGTAPDPAPIRRGTCHRIPKDKALGGK